jgi:hypothetical protein
MTKFFNSFGVATPGFFSVDSADEDDDVDIILCSLRQRIVALCGEWHHADDTNDGDANNIDED